MKKKANPRQTREQGKAAQRAKYQEEATQKKEAERQEAEQAERERQRQQAVKDREKMKTLWDSPSTERRSTAKAAGLKSTFILGEDHLLMTAFGKGNQALLEKDIVSGQVTDMRAEAAFQTIPDRERFLLNGRVPGASTDDPLHRAPESQKTGDDLIHCRSLLEQRYFGETFEDNIHIQLIYNILDIEKLLSGHINNIIYAVTNLLRDKIGDHEDLIGYVSWDKDLQKLKRSVKSKDESLYKLIDALLHQPQLGYYGLQVIPSDAQEARRIKRDPDALCLTDEEFYSILATLGTIRQMLAHGIEKNAKSVYTIGESDKDKLMPVQALMNRLYRERIEALNADFLNKAKNNLTIMFRIFGVTDLAQKRRYVQNYYDFVVRKQYKNKGFSIKKLRETMTLIIPEAQAVKDPRYDSVRQKVTAFFDFALYHHYEEHPDEIDALVNALRSCADETAKIDIYSVEARRVWPLVRRFVLDHILPDTAAIKDLVPDKAINPEMLDGVLINDDAHGFSKLIYMMTIFMDAKEINDLLTTLINKFENIGSFMDVLKSQGLKSEIDAKYRIFADAWDVAGELRVINSFARMRKPTLKARRQMYIEAARVLGDRSTDEALGEYFDAVLDTGKKADEKPTKRKEMGVRNFIANNVVDTPRFRYLARYADIRSVSQLAKSRPLLTFVLKDIPDEQIRRYFNAANNTDHPYDPAMRDALTDMLVSFSFDNLKDVRNNDRLMNRQEQEAKRSKQALVRLYLTVLYLTVKNLVYVNSRYFLAFHCVERDRLLFDSEKWRKIPDDKKYHPDYGFSAFARDFLAQYPGKRRVREYLNTNFANSDNYAVRSFRNKVEHLDAVRAAAKYIPDVQSFQSWFELYHYVMQRTLIDQFDFDKGRGYIDLDRLNPKMVAYAKLVLRHGTNCKDAVKALCVPFAYNLPRYKNLTIEGLFDKNRPGPKGCGKLDKAVEAP